MRTTKAFSERGSSESRGAFGVRGSFRKLWGFPAKMRSSLICFKVPQLEKA